MRERLERLVTRVKALRPVRVLQHYSDRRGALLAAGMSYRAIFAVFAALWVGFSIAGFLLRANPQLQDAVFATIGGIVPGLIDTGSGGAVDPQTLLEAQILGWTGAIALVALIWTALGWLTSAREGIRSIFGLPKPETGFVILKLKDLAIGAGLGVAVIVSAALSTLGTQALDLVLGIFGIGAESFFAAALARIVGLALMFALDTAALMVLYRVLSGIRIPWRRLITGSMVGAVGLGVLKVAAGLLLGRSGSNPLLASFAVIIGLLVWFNFLCQTILMAGSWIAVGMRDADTRQGRDGQATTEAANTMGG